MVESVASPSADESVPIRGGAFVAYQAMIWAVVAPATGLAVARLAVWAEHYRAPYVVFSLAVGSLLGLALAAVMRWGQIGHRVTIHCGAAVAVAVAVASQHFFSFLDARAAFLAQKPPVLSAEEFQELTPAFFTNFAEFMRREATQGRRLTADFTLHGRAVWFSWAIDGLLVLAAAMAVVFWLARPPYCRVCRSWYRTVRAGSVGEPAGQALAGMLPLPDPPIAAIRYRLSHCASGCGLGRLEVAWDDSQRRVHHCEVWLDASRRRQLARILDGDSINGGNA